VRRVIDQHPGFDGRGVRSVAVVRRFVIGRDAILDFTARPNKVGSGLSGQRIVNNESLLGRKPSRVTGAYASVTDRQSKA
jgi:hypothetical protein